MAQTKAEIEAENLELKAQLAAGGTTEAAEEDTRTVVQRILAIAKETGVIALEKKGGVPFAYRGIDDVVAHLSPLLNKHGVFVTPIDALQSLSQQPAANKVLTKADLTVTYRFYGAQGDYIDAQVPGQADDFADRSTAQAMSVAFRILLLQTFHIPAFGNEEEASQNTMGQRENSKIAAARGAGAPASAAPAQTAGPSPLVILQKQVGTAGAQAGLDGQALNALGVEISGKESTADWFGDAEVLKQMLVRINEQAKA